MINQTNTGGPAFPATAEQLQRGLEGMTLRDWFAGLLAPGVFREVQQSGDELTREEIAYEAWKRADAMLAVQWAREVEPPDAMLRAREESESDA